MSSAKFDHPVPKALQDLRRDKRGYPIPQGVWQDPKTGEYDFRVLDQQVRVEALKKKLCAISGLPMNTGEYWFIGGPSSFENRLFIDGPMCFEAAEFSMKTCPYLALRESRHRQSGLEKKYRPDAVSLEKSKVLMLAMAKNYHLEDAEGFLYVRAARWSVVSWWQDGQRLAKEEALAVLAEEVPELDISQGGRLKK